MKHLYILAGTSLCIASPALAQDQTGAASQADEIGDIVVTAQRRAERLQDVPIAVTAVEGGRLVAAGVTSLDSIAKIAPSVVTVRGSVAANFFLRGVGTSSGNAGAESPVSTFVDGVYQPSLSGTTLALNNIERVEVLKGPQGTLFGRNATGGAVNIITRTPNFDPALQGEVSYGNLNTIGGNVYATTGLTDTLALDLSFTYNNQQDGFGRNVTTGNDANDRRDLGVRSKLLWQPTDSLRFVLAGDFSKNTGAFGVSHRLFPGSVGIDGQRFTGGFYDTRGNVDSYVNTRLFGGSLTSTYNGSSVVVNSITAYRGVRSFLLGDLDMTPIPLFQYPLTEQGNQFTQELQLSSAGDGPFKWTVGAFYLNADGGFSSFQIEGLIVDQLAPGADYIRNRAIMHTQSYAAYGQGTYALSPATNLTVGFRYTLDERQFDATNFLGIGGTPVVVGGTKGSRSYGRPTWRVSIDHDLAHDSMVYASYNRGFKSGLYNTASPADPPVAPEQLDAWEIGAKTLLLDRRLRLNAAAFYYKYKDIQLTKIQGATQLLLNAASAKSYGVEVEVEARVANDLTLRGNVNWLHGEYSQFEGAPVSIPNPAGGNGTVNCATDPRACDVSGNQMVAAPRWTGGVALDYHVAAGNGGLDFSAGANYNSGYPFEPDGRLRQRPFVLVDGQIKWTLPGDVLHVRLFGNNLLNKKYYGLASATPVGDLTQVAPGRLYGVAIGAKF